MDPFLCRNIQLLFHSLQLTQDLGCSFFFLRKPLSQNGKQNKTVCRTENKPRATPKKRGSEEEDASHEKFVCSKTPFPSKINTGEKTAGSLEIKSDEVAQES